MKIEEDKKSPPERKNMTSIIRTFYRVVGSGGPILVRGCFAFVLGFVLITMLYGRATNNSMSGGGEFNNRISSPSSREMDMPIGMELFTEPDTKEGNNNSAMYTVVSFSARFFGPFALQYYFSGSSHWNSLV